MRIKDCEDMNDVVKYIMYKGDKQGYHTLDIEQIQNILLITYGKPIKEKKKDTRNLILSTKIKKDNEIPMKYMRVKLNLCNFIEPRKSKKREYERMRAEATKIEEVEK